MKFVKSKVHNILIIKIAAIGDVLLSTPVIENLRHNFPNANIDFLTQSYCGDMVIGNPFLNRTLTFNAGSDGGWCLVKTIRGKKYDLIIDLFGNPRTALITFWSRAKYRVGFKFNYRALAYNIKIKPRGDLVHNVEFNLDALRALDLEIRSSKPFLYIDPYYDREADRIFKELELNDKPVIAVNPCGTWDTKIWHKDYYIDLMKRFSGEYNILLLWGNDKEKELTEEIASRSGLGVKLIPFIGLKTLGAVLKKCVLLLTNDTGPMHIAWVLGVKTAAIFGPTRWEGHGPLSDNSLVIKNDEIDCLGCNLTKLEECTNEHKCMKGLTVEVVYKKLNKFIGKDL